jgi:hypothetical protein
VLEGLPSGKIAPKYDGNRLSNGTFAVVETTKLDETGPNKDDELGRSDLMMPVLKEASFDMEGNVVKRRFYLADVEAILDPCAVVPDIGGPKNRYFVVKPRNQWADDFITWISDPHNIDEMDPLDNVEVDEEKMAKLEENSSGSDES